MYVERVVVSWQLRLTYLAPGGASMRMDIVVRCVCGHRIGLNELLAHGFVVIDNEPAHVYLKYRCSVCDYQGLELMEYQRWNRMLQCAEPASEEGDRLRRLGPITAGEMLQFARQLGNLTDLELAQLQS
jgi:DNA-directed RNA polymerase subunit RPC12/RpoP